jgi:hypothetical protein
MAALSLDRRVAIALTLCSCISPTTSCPTPPPEAGTQVAAVLTTVTDGYNAGSLSVISLDDHTVCDDVTAVSPDPVVRVVDGTIVQINRYLHDSVRLYEPNRWSAPTLEYGVGVASNPQDAVRCADQWFVSLYGTSHIDVRDDKGRQVGQVDLTEYADIDGIPEASDLVHIDGSVYVGLQRWIRGEPWLSETEGAVVQIDCQAHRVVNSWVAPPNTRVTKGLDDSVLVYGDTNRLYSLHPDQPILHDLGVQLPHMATVAAWTPSGIVAVTRSEDDRYHINCVGDGENAVTLLSTGSYLVDAQANADEQVWITARRGVSDFDAPGGLYVVDATKCELMNEQPIQTNLAPYSIAFY